MSKTIKSFTAVVLFAAVLIAANYRTLTAQTATPAASGKSLTQVVEGRYRVEYDTASGPQRLDDIRRIELHDKYFVVYGFQEQGRVIPLEGTTLLRWDPS